MPGTCDSARSVRRCKACLYPVKGHPGPYGLARCTNRDVDTSSKTSTTDISSNTIAELVNAFQAVDVTADNEIEDLTEKPDESHLVTNEEARSTQNDNSNESADELSLNQIVKDKTVQSPQDGEETIMTEETVGAREDLKCSPGVFSLMLPADSSPVSSQPQPYQNGDWSESDDGSDSDNSSHFLSDPEEFSLKINDIVSRLDDSSVVNSEGPCDQLDIRPVLSGGQFCICQCSPVSNVSSCQCEGELLLDSKLAGVVKNQVFISLDLSQDFHEDLKPKVICDMDGWSMNKPSFVELRMVDVERRGVVVLEGKICLEAALETGPSGSIGVVRGTMGLVLEVGEEFENRGFKNPVTYKPVKFQLIRLEEDLELGDQ